MSRKWGTRKGLAQDSVEKEKELRCGVGDNDVGIVHFKGRSRIQIPPHIGSHLCKKKEPKIFKYVIEDRSIIHQREHEYGIALASHLQSEGT